MQHLGAVVRQLGRFPRVELRDDPGIGDDTRIGGEQARDILPERDPSRPERAGDERRGQVGATTTERCDLARGRGADEAGHDRHDAARDERPQHPLRASIGALVVGGRAAEGGVGVHHVQRIDVTRLGACGVERGGDQAGTETLAAGDKEIGGAGGELAEQPETARQRLELLEGIAHQRQQIGTGGAGRQDGAGDFGVP